MPIGVPQGSTLGPVLFAIYLNDFFKCHKLYSINYADDSSILHSQKNCLHTSIINKNLKSIYTWLCANKLKLNSEKSKFMIFSNKKNIIHEKIVLGNKEIEKIESMKLLGLWLDSKLTFAKHTKKLSSKLSFVSYIISKFSNLPKKILRKIYFSYAHSTLVYGIQLYGQSHNVHLKSIERIQKNLVKKISKNSDKYKAFIDNKILNFKLLKEFSLACYTHNILNNNNSPNLIKNLIKSNQNRVRRNRQEFKLYKPKINVTIMKRAFSYAAAELWNELPIFKNVCSKKVFRKEAKNYFLNKLCTYGS